MEMTDKGGAGRRRIPASGKAVYGCLAFFVVILNLCAWNSAAFCDWYIRYIFPIWVNTYGRLTGLFPFSVGEWMILAGVLLVVFAVVTGIVWAAVGSVTLIRRVAGRKAAGRKAVSCGFGRFARAFYRTFAWILLAVCLVMTLNCFVLYHASPFSQQHFPEDDGEYTIRELIEVYNLVAEACNRLSGEMKRDEEGHVIYPGSQNADGKLLDMQDMARQAMEALGQEYPGLSGYYPRPKPMFFSDFMCQQYMQGYYFPFSMEANYNDVMYILNQPSTMCHELAHLRGYIYEDEANFIGYLACVKTEDPFFQYAGYLSVLDYLHNDLYRASKAGGASYEQAILAVPPVAVSRQVWEDNLFVSQEEWDRINRKAWIDTEVVDKAADAFIDTNLKVNGIADGKTSYSRVVRLLIQYYRKNI